MSLRDKLADKLQQSACSQCDMPRSFWEGLADDALEEILATLPIVFTKDSRWASETARHSLKPGAIIVLPEDAVLAVMPSPKEKP